jgi:hypothetical protein
MPDLVSRLEQMSAVSGLRVCLHAANEIRRLRAIADDYARLRKEHVALEREAAKLISERGKNAATS